MSTLDPRCVFGFLMAASQLYRRQLLSGDVRPGDNLFNGFWSGRHLLVTSDYTLRVESDVRVCVLDDTTCMYLDHWIRMPKTPHLSRHQTCIRRSRYETKTGKFQKCGDSHAPLRRLSSEGSRSMSQHSSRVDDGRVGTQNLTSLFCSGC